MTGWGKVNPSQPYSHSTSAKTEGKQVLKMLCKFRQINCKIIENILRFFNVMGRLREFRPLDRLKLISAKIEGKEIRKIT